MKIYLAIHGDRYDYGMDILAACKTKSIAQDILDAHKIKQFEEWDDMMSIIPDAMSSAMRFENEYWMVKELDLIEK